MGQTNFDEVAANSFAGPVTGLAANATVKANASTASVAVADFPKNNTNTGASGAIVLTLPAVALVAGKTMRMQITVAQSVTLTPPSGVRIYLGGSGVASKYLLIAGVIGNYVELYCDGSSYLVSNYSGVVTKEA